MILKRIGTHHRVPAKRYDGFDVKPGFKSAGPGAWLELKVGQRLRSLHFKAYGLATFR